MMTVWPNINNDLTDAAKSAHIDVSKWLTKVLEYNVPGGKKIRALTLIYSYKLLAPNEQQTKEKLRLVRILGWCIELLQAGGLMLDDIEDRSLMQRGKQCWYQRNDVGLMAINDGLTLENSVYYLIQKHFKKEDCYVYLIERVHTVNENILSIHRGVPQHCFFLLTEQLYIMKIFPQNIWKTILSQSLDMLSTNSGKKPNLALFIMDRYKSIVEYKTSYYTFI
ncbi:farnesyl pyrophosphate synthase-like [Solenopsis invicta]|uniref:farnesyl pyrophosphate synthase-like n=1 Tax=Solenopsis invicta TaxID=13686 RepID=UPI00193DD6FA|nr:farnesyl pyrophosphate synthase-like [Solenopsis invicta]XP_039301976.1 farnesyl pyrophosphate synthase-like [Solenopsis invicta]